MRKQIITQYASASAAARPHWLDIERFAQVEISSEDSAHPIESAFKPGAESSWRAAEPGEQIIRLVFDEPLRLEHIRAVFHETERARTQEFLLRWSPGAGGPFYREVVRQQYTFSPPQTSCEIEDFNVDLNGVMVLDLSIVPDTSGSCARASLTELRLA